MINPSVCSSTDSNKSGKTHNLLYNKYIVPYRNEVLVYTVFDKGDIMTLRVSLVLLELLQEFIAISIK